MDINGLRAFTFVANYGTFAEAAKALYVSESTVSRQVKSLEDSVDFLLFSRSRKGIALTDEGRRMLHYAESATEAFDAFVSAAKEERERERALNINYSGARFEADIIAGALTMATAAGDPLIVNSLACDVGKSWRKLGDGKIDLIVTFVECVPNHPDIVSEEIYVSRLKLAVSRAHPLASKMRVRLSDLNGERLVLFKRKLAPLGYDWTVKLLEEAGATVAIKTVPTANYDTILEKVATEGSIALMTDWYENPLPRHIVYVDIDDAKATNTTSFAWRIDSDHPMIPQFVKYARQYVQKTYGRR